MLQYAARLLTPVEPLTEQPTFSAENRFYHSKGFMCDGDEFVGDWETTPKFVAGNRIGVRLDLTQGLMSFTCNGTRVPGGIQGIRSTVLPVVYMDNLEGKPASCTFVSLPAPAK